MSIDKRQRDHIQVVSKGKRGWDSEVVVSRNQTHVMGSFDASHPP